MQCSSRFSCVGDERQWYSNKKLPHEQCQRVRITISMVLLTHHTRCCVIHKCSALEWISQSPTVFLSLWPWIMHLFAKTLSTHNRCHSSASRSFLIQSHSLVHILSAWEEPNWLEAFFTHIPCHCTRLQADTFFACLLQLPSSFVCKP